MKDDLEKKCQREIKGSADDDINDALSDLNDTLREQIDKLEAYDNCQLMKEGAWEKEYRKSIINAYRKFVSDTMTEISSIEEIIIKCPNIGTVRDGSKAIYANECRQLIALLLTDYYFTENLDKWNKFKELLKSRIENELNYEKKGVTTERVSRNWATNGVLKNMFYAESELCEEVI